MALTNFLTTDKALASVLNDRVVTPANAHINSTGNPHSVTKTQVGLANVTNDVQIPKTLLTTAGDTIYASAANTPAKLAKGTNGQVLTLASGLPSWATPVKVVTGAYSGDGTTDKTISLGFTPKQVFIEFNWSSYNHYVISNIPGGTNGVHFVDPPFEFAISANNSIRPLITANGFIVSGAVEDSLNYNGGIYRYIAIG